VTENRPHFINDRHIACKRLINVYKFRVYTFTKLNNRRISTYKTALSRRRWQRTLTGAASKNVQAT